MTCTAADLEDARAMSSESNDRRFDIAIVVLRIACRIRHRDLIVINLHSMTRLGPSNVLGLTRASQDADRVA